MQGVATPVRPSAPPTGEMTGRSLVLLRAGSEKAAGTDLKRQAGVQLAEFAYISAAQPTVDLAEGAAAILPKLGVAIVQPAPDQTQALSMAAAQSDAILAIEPERVVYALEGSMPAEGGGYSPDYLRGYRDAVIALTTPHAAAQPAVSQAAPRFQDSATATWGLQATGVLGSASTGAGVPVAVLDTGLDLTHPDFLGRSITAQSFVSGEDVQDGNGHGTHCMGTACGPVHPQQLPRYGIASEALLLAGKVLNNLGRGVDGDILAGIDWAISSGCRVVSMSLGARLAPGVHYSDVFEATAQRALSAGCATIAAAGNDSRRDQGLYAPVSHPANCPSIVAVGALDQSLQVAYFSNRGISPEGGQIDICGPGVDVRSTWPMSTAYQFESGTSMATPHVAGIAALFLAARGDLAGGGVIAALCQAARRLPLPAPDIGAGLVQAPS